MKTPYILVALFLSLILSACYTVDFVRYSDETYTESAAVEVFRTKPVDREYIELGELSIRIKTGIFGNQEDVVLKLKEKAKEIGADAIIILGEDSEGNMIVPVGNLYMSVDVRYLKAIAIKYKKE